MWNTPTIAVIYPPEVERPLKLLFAAALVRQPDNPWEAAREAEPHAGKAHWIATNWIEDELVLAECARLRAALGPIAKVPTKEQFAAEIYQDAKAAKTGSERLSYYQFFAKVMGYVDSGKGDGVNININNQPKTMIVPVAASDDEWERTALAHQQVLNSYHG